MKPLALSALLLLLAYGGGKESMPALPAPLSVGDSVYVTPTGKAYHRQACDCSRVVNASPWPTSPAAAPAPGADHRTSQSLKSQMHADGGVNT